MVAMATKLAGSASLQFMRQTAVGVYICCWCYAEVINRRINSTQRVKLINVQLYNTKNTEITKRVELVGHCHFMQVRPVKIKLTLV